jgi:glycosyltransferase involved in cell wall biosynthesis
MTEVLFWVSLALAAYPYAGYPLLLALLPPPRRSARPVGAAAPSDPAPATVTLLVAARNEEAQIGGRIEELLGQDFPRERLEILVASDASTDRTDEIVAAFGGHVRLVRSPERLGKVGAQNLAIPHATGEILVLTDAASRFAPGTLRALVDAFADPSIGCVSTEDDVRGGSGERLYVRFEMGLRRLEARFHSLIGVSGSGYAVRRALVSTFPAELPNDFVTPLLALRAGYRAVPEPRAVAVYGAAPGARVEFRRKVRTVIRGIATLLWARALLDPIRSPRTAFLLVSHKLLRWTVPLMLLVLLASSARLAARGGGWRIAVGAQALLYGTGLLGVLLPALRAALPVRIAHFFLLSNASIAVAWVRFALGDRAVAWEPTRREVAL